MCRRRRRRCYNILFLFWKASDAIVANIQCEQLNFMTSGR